ncbi:hypothetical protein [Paenibacillus taichungensis]|uniref:hypothetical protein n=1 Tax=Paenibacillus taichungensis TaxID=484184 RepID=UPI0035D9EA2A
MKNVTVNITGMTDEDLLLAIDQIYQKLSNGYTSGADRNASGNYMFEVYGTQSHQDGGINDDHQAEA